MRLSNIQKEFLQSIYDPEMVTNFWECFKKEKRTALFLSKKGFVEFETNPPNEHSCIRLTKKGRWFCLTKKICEICGSLICPMCSVCCNPDCEL